MFDKLDDPLVTDIIFFPRKAHPSNNMHTHITDGHVTIEDDIRIGYRLYEWDTDRPLILYFHGNGEIAADYDGIADLYDQRVGVNLMVVDFRGYGWSTGMPKTTAMFPDAEKVFQALPAILGEHMPTSVYVMGRSLGGPSAMHLATKFNVSGLIVESTLSNILTWLLKKGLPPERLPESSPELDFAERLSQLDVPLLVIHGERDTLIPPSEGEKLYRASAADQKHLVLIQGAGHNTLLSVGADRYFQAIKTFITEVEA